MNRIVEMKGIKYKWPTFAVQDDSQRADMTHSLELEVYQEVVMEIKVNNHRPQCLHGQSKVTQS